MTEYLKNVLVFLALAAGLAAGSQYLYVRVFAADGLVSRSDRGLWQADQPVGTLIVGDSHVQYGIDPSLLPRRSYNLSFGGEGYVQSYYKLRRIFSDWRYGDSVRHVIVPVGLHSFSSLRASRLFPGDQAAVWAAYVDPWDYMRATGPSLDVLSDYVRARTMAYNGELDAAIQWASAALGRPTEVRPLRRGFVPSDRSFGLLSRPLRATTAAQRAEYHFAGHDPWDPTLELYLRRILELCHRHGIDVSLVSTPVARPYFDIAVTTYGVDPGFQRVQEIAREWPNASYHNFIDLYLDDFDLFHDADHLNEAGARVFTVRLREALDGSGAPDATEPGR